MVLSKSEKGAKRWIQVALALALSPLACGGDESSLDPEPALEGEPVLQVIPGPSCGDPCLFFTLYLNDDGAAEMRSHLHGEQFVGRSQGDLKPDTRGQLEGLLAEVALGVEEGVIDSGIDPECDWILEASYTLYTADRSIQIDPLCPTPELAPLTELLHAVYLDLYFCDTSERLSPRIGCEPLDPYAQ